MRAVIQRVTDATVTVDGDITGAIEQGLVVLLGVGKEDNSKDVAYLAEKVCNLRIFEDENEKMNLSLRDIGGSLLVVSQFTLYGDVRKGRRPGFEGAASPDRANALYEEFVEDCQALGVKVDTGKFQTHMQVALVNDGPVTILLDSKKLF